MRSVLPGRTIGILGGGQLGRMLAFEAKRNGYKVVVLDPTKGCPAGLVADEEIIADYGDLNAALRLAEMSDVITYEFENVDVGIVEKLEKSGFVVFPGSHVLKVSQHRLLEKNFLSESGIDVVNFYGISSLEDLKEAEEIVGYPALLKTVRFGYDGKGQVVINNFEQAQEAFINFGGQELIWEQLVEFEKEISVVCARNISGQVVVYPVSENIHKDNILDVSMVPARVSDKVCKKAEEIAMIVADRLGVVGTFCIELFVMPNGNVLANEIAPRPHNSGHFSLDACKVSQFENQMRAVCSLPLGSPELLSPVVMINILGSDNGNILLGVDELLKDPDVKLHLYEKSQSRSKRKMGHFTVMAKSVQDALVKAEEARKKIYWGEL